MPSTTRLLSKPLTRPWIHTPSDTGYSTSCTAITASAGPRTPTARWTSSPPGRGRSVVFATGGNCVIERCNGQSISSAGDGGNRGGQRGIDVRRPVRGVGRDLRRVRGRRQELGDALARDRGRRRAARIGVGD